MTGGFGDTASKPTQSSSFSNNNDSNNGDTANFECSICLDLANDPVVTLCGHLFCWPCIYKWLQMHSHSHECPICKAFIESGKLVPLYGRGKNSSDSRSKSFHGGNIPKRPAGQRPETGQQQDGNAFVHHGSGYIGGFGPAISASFGNFTFSFGGFIPSIFSVQMNAFTGAPVYGNGYSHGDHHAYEVHQQRVHHREVSPFLIVGLLFLIALFWE